MYDILEKQNYRNNKNISGFQEEGGKDEYVKIQRNFMTIITLYNIKMDISVITHLWNSENVQHQK